ncbi:MAG: D-2-hydroxyacid dehydrogenase [Phycisphaerae bacterium]
MNIVVLDGHAANPGDLSWEALEAMGEVTVYPRTGPDEVVERAAGAQAVLTNKTLLPADVLEQLPGLTYIGVLATGTNVVDIDAARKRGIHVTNVPGYSTPSVAQAVFALLLELTNHVGHHARTVREGRWTACEDFAYWDLPIRELAGLTFGIVGYGAIGRRVAAIAAAFGMDVIAHTRSPIPNGEVARPVDHLQTLLAESDVVSLHCPLTPETAELINAERLATMKPTAILINTGRGDLVNEQALADALNEGRIAGAGLDVLSSEPPSADNPLLTAKNCIVTPHHAWASEASRRRLLGEAAANLRAFVDGNQRNVIA